MYPNKSCWQPPWRMYTVVYSYEIQLDSLFFPLENIESDSPHLFGFQSFDQGWKMNDLTTAEHKIDNDNHFQINRCLTHCQWVSERVTVSIFLYLCYDLLRFTVFLLCSIFKKKSSLTPVILTCRVGTRLVLTRRTSSFIFANASSLIKWWVCNDDDNQNS